MDNTVYPVGDRVGTIRVGSIEGSSDSLIQIHGRVLRVNEFTTFLIQEVSAGKSAAEIAAAVNAKGLFSACVSEAQIEALIAREIAPLFNNKSVKDDSLSNIRCKIVLLKFEQMRFILRIFIPLFRPVFFFSLLAIGTLITAWFLLFGSLVPVRTNFTISYFVVSLVCLFSIMLLHELGHAAAAYKNKIEPAEIGTGLYFLFPVFYADVSESWRLLPRKRLMVNLAGVYMQLLINIAIIVFLFAMQGWRHNDFLVQIVIANSLSIGFNLIPFFKLDGYWLVSDMLNIPNLRRSSSDHLQSIFFWLTKRRTTRPELNLPLSCYAIGQVIFALTMLCAMLIFLKNSVVEMINIGAGEWRLAEAINQGLVRYTLVFLVICILGAKIYSVFSKICKRAIR